MAKVKLDEVIASLLNEMDTSLHHRRRLFDLGVDALRELNLDVKGRIRTTVIDVNSNKTVDYPQDYINYIKIGVPNDRGEIATLVRNKDMNLYDSLGSRSISVPADPDDYSIYNMYRNYNLDGITYNLFGAGSNADIGYFRADDENMLFCLDQGCTYSEIVVEYLSNQIDDDGDFFVDERLEEAVKAYVYWKSIQRIKNIPMYEKTSAQNEWIKQKRKGKSRVNPFRLSEANDVTRKTIKLALKH
jgi:aryl carrier-like protein